jgi:hypothetical protein
MFIGIVFTVCTVRVINEYLCKKIPGSFIKSFLIPENPEDDYSSDVNELNPRKALLFISGQHTAHLLLGIGLAEN